MPLNVNLGWTVWTIIVTSVPSLMSDPLEDSWQLVWADEFDESNINLDKWGFDLENYEPDYQELQVYTNRSENAFISNGSLIIQAEKEKTGKNKYTSARMHTNGKADWKFGLFKVRFRFPDGSKTWPVILLYPTFSKFGKWPVSGEIYIAEDDRTIGGYEISCQVAVGRQPLDRRFQPTFYGVPDRSKFSDRFHEVTLEWQPDIIRWYLNGVETSECTVRREDIEKDGPAFIYPFNDRFYLIINFAVGGLVVGNPDTKTAFPQRLQIDYVRVYQKPYMF